MKQLFVIVMIMMVFPVLGADHKTLIDFTQASTVKSFKIVTDASERDAGKSHGTLSFQDGKKSRQTFFFAYLNPQPNGAAFVSVKLDKSLALADKDVLLLHAKNISEGAATFELMLDTKDSIKGHYSYRQRFTLEDHAQHTIALPLVKFEPSYRNRDQLPEGIRPLNPADIQAVGIRIIGRVHPKQAGLYGLALNRLDVYRGI
jgi:hypothetical protein